MSTDTADDLEYAETLLGEAAGTLSALVEAVFCHRPTVLRIDPGENLHTAIEEAGRVAEDWAGYCRPTCGHRESGSCETGDPDYCGCPCRHEPPDDASGRRQELPADDRDLIDNPVTPSVEIPDSAWQDGDYDHLAPRGHRLVATVVVNGTAMRVEAHMMFPGTDPQKAVAGDDTLAAVHNVSYDGPWPTTSIRGRRYVLIATPTD